VTSPRDVTNAMRTARGNKKPTIPVAISREKKEITLTVALPEDTGAPKIPKSTAIRQLQMD
jgi:hypothetical protein